MAEVTKIVRALDIGFGNVKWVQSYEREAENDVVTEKIVCGSFPSVVIAASEQDLDNTFGIDSLAKTDLFKVPVKETTYLVGKGILDKVKPGTPTAMLNEKWIEDDDYQARFLGALRYMQKDLSSTTINLLVLGLPVSSYKMYANVLVDRYQGKTFAGKDGAQITIEKVKVFAQPLGAVMDYMLKPEVEVSSEYAKVTSQNNLVIDIGFHTFDWLVARGFIANESRSGATNIGVANLIRIMCEHIQAKAQKSSDQLFKQINVAIRNNSESIRVDDQSFKLTFLKELPSVQAAMKDAITAMMNSVQDFDDLDNILLVGGGAALYEPLIKAKWPMINLICPEDSLFANVKGFQKGGIRALQSASRSANKTTGK